LQQLPFPSSEAGEVSQYRDLDLILSFPGLGNGIAATILAEASQALAKRDYHALRCYAGIAPVTRQSARSDRLVCAMLAIFVCGMRSIICHAVAFSAICDLSNIMPSCARGDTATDERCGDSRTGSSSCSSPCSRTTRLMIVVSGPLALPTTMDPVKLKPDGWSAICQF